MEKNICQKKYFSFGIVLFLGTILIFLIGFYLGANQKKTDSPSLVSQNGADCSETISEIKQRLIKGGHIPLPPKEVYSLFDAAIQRINEEENYLIVAPSLVLQNPFEDLFPHQIKINLSDDIILERVIKEIDADTQEETYRAYTIGIDYLSPNQTIDITSKENIIQKDEITAIQITLKEF